MKVYKKILVTGGEGQLASSFSSLFSDDYKIYCFNKGDLDITNIKNVDNVINEVQPDIILNCAAMTNVDLCEINEDDCYNVNFKSINNFKNSFNGLFIQLSTDYVFNGQSGPYFENDNPDPLNIYGRSKLNSEILVKKLFKENIILRTNILFSNKSNASFVSWVLNSLKNKKNISVIDDQFNNPISVEDCSKIIDILISKKCNGIFHAGTNKVISRYDFAKIIATNSNYDCNLITPISSKEFFSKKNVKALRPLNSGLLSEYDFISHFDLKSSLTISKY
jgi:dTDP-4-dehydrorhamnose reductase